MSLVNNRKSLAIAATAGGAVFVLFGSMILNTSKPAPPPVETPKYVFVVAKTTIKKGEEIKIDNVETKEFPVSIDGTYNSTSDIIGRSANEDIMAGAPVLKQFVGALVQKIVVPKVIEPDVNYRAVPVLIKKSSIPPFITTKDRFDLITRENSMKIENLKILDILPVPKNDDNRILLIEIAEKDINAFIGYYVVTKGFIFLQKNAQEFGDYVFRDLKREKIEKEKREEMEALEAMAKLMEKEPCLPSEPVKSEKLPDIEDLKLPEPETKQIKEVEVVIGNVKSKVEFEDDD